MSTTTATETTCPACGSYAKAGQSAACCSTCNAAHHTPTASDPARRRPTEAEAAATLGVRRDRTTGEWTLQDAYENEVGPRLGEALTITAALAVVAEAKGERECGGCGARGPVRRCHGLGQLCERCAMECPCNLCAG